MLYGLICLVRRWHWLKAMSSSNLMIASHFYVWFKLSILIWEWEYGNMGMRIFHVCFLLLIIGPFRFSIYFKAYPWQWVLWWPKVIRFAASTFIGWEERNERSIGRWASYILLNMGQPYIVCFLLACSVSEWLTITWTGLWTQIVTFEIWDIWSEWCQDKKTKRPKDQWTKIPKKTKNVMSGQFLTLAKFFLLALV